MLEGDYMVRAHLALKTIPTIYLHTVVAPVPTVGSIAFVNVSNHSGSASKVQMFMSVNCHVGTHMFLPGLLRCPMNIGDFLSLELQ